jgi:lipopolysaccharide transport system ATP-binding protein
VSNEPVIKVENLSKAYTIWESPAARLHGPILGQIGQVPFLPSGTRKLCRRLSHEAFKYFFALRGVSFEVRRGESVGIIGLNGSGKSTLLQIIAGTLEPTEGRVIVTGRVAALLELGSGFNAEFTGRENVYLYASILGLSRGEIESRFQSIADFAEIGEFIEQPVKTYSSGMQMRLAYSVITAVSPDILIVDEALSVGDAYFQHKCFAQIRRFIDRGSTLLFVSHDPGAVKSLCNRAILLDAGVMIRDDQPEAVVDYYNAIIAKRQADHVIRQSETLGGKRTTRSGNNRATISSVELLENDKSVRVVQVGSPVNLRVTAVANECLPELTVGFLLRDRLGNDIFGTNTYHLKVPLSVKAGQAFTVNFEIPSLRLGLGHYSVSVALHTYDTHVENSFDWWDRALVLQVIPGDHPQFIGACHLTVTAKADLATGFSPQPSVVLNTT